MTQSLARESHQAEVGRCGLPGLVERRSRPFTVDGVDQKLISRARPLFEVVRKAYFRVDSSGWEQLPEPPVLLVGVHAGATTSALPAPSGNTRPALQKDQARSPGQAAARCLPTGTAWRHRPSTRLRAAQMTIHPTAATGSTRPPPTSPATVVPLSPHPSPGRRLAATWIRSTGGVAGDGRSELAEAATGLWHACRAMPAAAVTAVLLLAEGLLLVPLWAAIRCAIAAWHRLRRPAGPAPTPHAPGLPGTAPPVR